MGVPPPRGHPRGRSARLRRGALGFGLALATLAGASAPAPARASLETIVQDDGSLLYRAPDQVRASMTQLRALGVDTVRLTANWSLLTRDPDGRPRPAFDATDPGAYDQDAWRGLDNAVAAARQAGLNAMVDIGFWAPLWATTQSQAGRARTNVDPRAFRDFAVAVVRRYSGSWAVPAPPSGPAPAPPPPSADQQLLDALFGTPAAQPVAQPPPPPGPLPRVQRFTLWNEPNQPGLLLPQWVRAPGGPFPQSATIYRRMVSAAYPAIKAVRPDTTILVGATASTGSYRARGPVPPLRFLRALACVDAHFQPLRSRDCRHFSPIPGDGWSHHPYAPVTRPDLRSPAGEPDNGLVADLPKLSATLNRLVAMGRLAPALRGIYSTEFGYETTATPGRAPLSQSQQAQWITWAEYVSQRVPAVKSFAQFLLRDQPPGSVVVSNTVRPFGQYYTGLERGDGQPKLAERSFIAGLFAERSTRGRVMLWSRLRLGSGPHVIRFERRLGRGPWRPVSTVAPSLMGPPDVQLTLDGQSSVQRFATLPARTSFRLDYRDASGNWVAQLPVPVISALPGSPVPRPAGERAPRPSQRGRSKTR